MVAKNNQIADNHMRKDWQRYIKTHFDQPFRRKRRALLRKRKAATKAPRPLEKLRPAVVCPTLKYNMRIRTGRGFSLLELKRVGLRPHYARTIGIAVDPRRRNRSEEGLARNAKRLKKYLETLVLFPNKPKGKDARNQDKLVSYYTSVARARTRLSRYSRYVKEPLPLSHKKEITKVVNVSEVPDYNVFATLKNEKLVGKHHFKWRRHNKRLAFKRKRDQAKAAKKELKGDAE
jgi:large subunit ribosomal protein L13e